MKAKKAKRLTNDIMIKMKDYTKERLHSLRDSMRIVGTDIKTVPFDCRHQTYGQIYGFFECLVQLGYGYFGPINLNAVEDRKREQPEANFSWFIRRMEEEVLHEEGFYDGTFFCKTCHEKYKRG